MALTLKNKIATFGLQFVFINLIDFALGSVSYFGLYILGLLKASFDNPARYGEVMLANTFESLSALVLIHILIFFSDKIRSQAVIYVLLCAGIYISGTIIWIVLFSRFEYIFSYKIYWPSTVVEAVFRLSSPLAGVIVYAFSTRETILSQKINHQEYELLELKELKTKAELEALQAKINPHFLYNSLNSIASLIREDPEKAEKMVILLARFFRHSTNAQSQYMTSLADEIAMVETYLEVEKVRFDERLEYKIWFENEPLKACMVPQFLIQPLVENAIKHGLSKIVNRGILWIKIFDLGKDIQIIIYDNGPPFPQQFDSGYGLRSTQDKLRLLMGEHAKMEIVNGEEINNSGQPFKHIKITLEKRLGFHVTETKNVIVA